MLEQRMNQVRARCAELIAQANRTWNMTLPDIQITFNLTGTTAGWARYYPGGRYEMRFNREMIMNESWNHIISDTVPHELAHIVCFYRNWDRGHGATWRRVCRALGGSGKTCHREAVVYAKGETYVYITTTGREMRLSEQRHQRVQAGRVYNYRLGYGTVNRHCRWSVLGNTAAAVQPVVAKTPVVQTPVVQTATFVTQAGSKAERVREIIRRVKAADGSPQDAQRLAVQELALTAAYARSCVAFNWPRV